MLKLVNKLLAGLAICAMSWGASRGFPEYAWLCGWLGACAYYITLVVYAPKD